MGSVKVEPKSDSYVIEWEAVRSEGAGSFASFRRLVKNTSWTVQMVLERDDITLYVFTTMHPTGIEQWNVWPGEWVVKSPNGRFWFMSESEFQSQFDSFS